MRFKIGKCWVWLVWDDGTEIARRFSEHPEKRTMGFCDPPGTPHRRMVLRQGIGQFDELEFTIHEYLHLARWSLPERFVKVFAHGVARLLWRLGWRKTGG